VLSVAPGDVVEVGSDRVVVRLNQPWQGQTVLIGYAQVEPGVAVGARVGAGQAIGRVMPAAGGAGPDGLRLGIRLVSGTGDEMESVPVNPHLWLRPLVGTGTVAGRIVDASGQPVADATVHGLILAYPEETPFDGGVTSYATRIRPDPAYGEHFAIGDVPAGRYLVGVEIGGTVVFQRAIVREGSVTFLDFSR
jgi:hypothetical protein